MGIWKAISSSIGSVLQDQYKEFFYFDTLPNNLLVVRGKARKGQRSQNNGDENIITKGSIIVVSDGEGVAIVSQGKVSTYLTEPGEYIYGDSEELSVFSEGLIEGTKANIKEIGKRVSFGGVTPMTQRFYYFNMKEIVGEEYETGYMPFHVIDRNAGVDMDMSVKCSGTYSFRIMNPKLFYENVCGNIEYRYYKEGICHQLTTELLTVFPVVMTRISSSGMRFYEILEQTQDLLDALNEELSNQWRELRGIEVVSAGIRNFEVSKKDWKLLKQMQAIVPLQDVDRARAYLVSSQAEAMVKAAANPGLKMLYRQSTSSQYGYRCNQCGWTPPDETKPPKFCPECGDRFDAKDLFLKKG